MYRTAHYVTEPAAATAKIEQIDPRGSFTYLYFALSRTRANHDSRTRSVCERKGETRMHV